MLSDFTGDDRGYQYLGPAQFMDDAQLHEWISAVDNVGHGWPWQDTLGKELVLGQILFPQSNSSSRILTA